MKDHRHVCGFLSEEYYKISVFVGLAGCKTKDHHNLFLRTIRYFQDCQDTFYDYRAVRLSDATHNLDDHIAHNFSLLLKYL